MRNVLICLFIRYKFQSCWEIPYVQWKIKEWYILTWILPSFTYSYVCVFVFFLQQDIKLHLCGLKVWIFKGAEEKQFHFCSIDITHFLLAKIKIMEMIWLKAYCNQATADKVKHLIITLIFQMPSSLNDWPNMDTGCLHDDGLCYVRWKKLKELV